MSATTRKRTRLTPAARKALILDAAARLVLDEGMTNLTMTAIASAAGVSKALIYAYFPNLTDLLYAVYERETKLLNQQHRRVLAATHSFEEMVRATASISRHAMDERQRLVERLVSDPLLAPRVTAEQRRQRDQVVKYLGREITKHYALSDTLAAKATRLALRFEPAGRMNPDQEAELDEIWGAMIVGAMKELQARWGTADTQNDT
ncbi:MAG: helix-turn-helix domain-containing protein [Pseudomonadota bacterium]